MKQPLEGRCSTSETTMEALESFLLSLTDVVSAAATASEVIFTCESFGLSGMLSLGLVVLSYAAGIETACIY